MQDTGGQRAHQHVVEPRRRRLIPLSDAVGELDDNRASHRRTTSRRSRLGPRIIGLRGLGNTVVRSPVCWAVTGLLMITGMVAVVFQLEPPELKRANDDNAWVPQPDEPENLLSSATRCVAMRAMALFMHNCTPHQLHPRRMVDSDSCLAIVWLLARIITCVSAVQSGSVTPCCHVTYCDRYWFDGRAPSTMRATSLV